jgi:2-deoxy-scyllo-inosamine dehydrogenase (SAM-dependent)/8-amino-3,8-dideoxy-alpha-D-manno-octulosonate transaminase
MKTTIPLFERMQIESQSNCNRSCWFCPRTYDRAGKYLDETGRSVVRQMPTSKILDLLDQAQGLGFQGRVTFYHYSEPLLDQRNIMLAHEARKRGMRPYLHTNGDVLKKDDGLCTELKRAYGLIVIGLYDYETNGKLEEAKRYWRQKLAGANLEFSPIGSSGARSAYSIGVPRALVPPDPRMAMPDFTYINAPCHRPLVRMLIQYDGEMCNCCEDTYGSFKLGNVYESSLEELWFSERHVQLVENLVAGQRQKYELCRNCPMPPTGPAPQGKKINIARKRYIETTMVTR